jgi:hypothetical protein
MELRNNKEVVLEAVKQNGGALEYASMELRNDKEIVLEVVKQNGYTLRYASEELRGDKEVILEAVKQNGNTLQFASEELRNDKEVVLEAIRENKYMIKYANDSLKKWFEESKYKYYMKNQKEELSMLLNFEDWIILNKELLLLKYENKITTKEMDKEIFILLDEKSNEKDIQDILNRFQSFQKELYKKYVEDFNSTICK